jgi:hypothetical protein
MEINEFSSNNPSLIMFWNNLAHKNEKIMVPSIIFKLDDIVPLYEKDMELIAKTIGKTEPNKLPKIMMKNGGRLAQIHFKYIIVMKVNGSMG